MNNFIIFVLGVFSALAAIWYKNRSTPNLYREERARRQGLEKKLKDQEDLHAEEHRIHDEKIAEYEAKIKHYRTGLVTDTDDDAIVDGWRREQESAGSTEDS